MRRFLKGLFRLVDVIIFLMAIIFIIYAWQSAVIFIAKLGITLLVILTSALIAFHARILRIFISELQLG